MESKRFENHTRENLGWLARAEKRALVWMAERMPARVNSDHLTALGLAAMLLTAASFWASRWEPLALLGVVVFLAVNWFGDSLDGTLARVRNQQRPRYGFYVDHMVDIIGTTALIVGMGLSGLMSTAVAAGLLLAYVVLTAEVYLATYTLGVFKLSYWNVGPTELRVLLVVGALKALHHPGVTLFGHKFLLFDVGGMIGIAGLVVTITVTVLRHTRSLYRAEPLN
jgi:phosphatidylglycerophosphate synthase